MQRLNWLGQMVGFHFVGLTWGLTESNAVLDQHPAETTFVQSDCSARPAYTLLDAVRLRLMRQDLRLTGKNSGPCFERAPLPARLLL